MTRKDKRNKVNPKWKFLHSRPKAYFVLLPFFFMFFLFVNSVSASTTDTIGGTANGDDSYAIGGSGTVYANYQPVTASASGALQTIGFNLAYCGSNNINVAIYSDNGSPDALLGSGTANCGDGWNDIAVTGVSIVATTKYWIAIKGDSSVIHFYSNMGPNRCYEETTYAAAWSNPAGETCDNNVVLNSRITYGVTAPTPIIAFIKWLTNINQWIVLRK